MARLAFLGLVGFALFVYMQQPSGSKAQPAFVAQTCGPSGAVTASFAWPAVPPATEQTWLDVGLTKDFVLGWYEGHGPLPPSQTAYVVDGLAPGATYFYRVHVQAKKDWSVAAAGSFVASCAAPPAPPAAIAPAPIPADDPAARDAAPVASTIVQTLIEQPAVRDAVVGAAIEQLAPGVDVPGVDLPGDQQRQARATD